MITSLSTAARERFFDKIAQRIGCQEVDCVLITHLLPDRPELLGAINKIAVIKLVIGIEYSVVEEARSIISEGYVVIVPPLADLFCRSKLMELLDGRVGARKFIIIEIGGYFAPHLLSLQQAHGNKLIGLIEDTENGHRNYEAQECLCYPVISVARSPLKEAEDALVGPSCIFSAEKILREQGLLLSSVEALVLGYGKVGRGTAQALRQRGISVIVYDPNVARAAAALGDGFRTPDRSSSLASANIIFGCSGSCSLESEDFERLRSGSMLVSCSSKRVEFAMEALAASYKMTKIAPYLDRYDRETRSIFVLKDGMPINFADGAVIGPVLSLVQGEMLFAIRQLCGENDNGLTSVSQQARDELAAYWLSEFVDPTTGCYKR